MCIGITYTSYGAGTTAVARALLRCAARRTTRCRAPQSSKSGKRRRKRVPNWRTPNLRSTVAATKSGFDPWLSSTVASAPHELGCTCLNLFVRSLLRWLSATCAS